jgi:ectoine hydroxylase-related dioxygenase (phytanoyl-CoA dioxygenase family)
MGVLSRDQLRQWREEGHVVLRGFAEPAVCEAMRERAIAIARGQADGAVPGEALVVQEPATRASALHPEDAVGKIFRLHHEDPVFRRFAHDEALGARIEELLGPAFDVFLSQFIFKNPGALGQPWHQDSFYFPMEPDRQLGVWLAVTEATMENGPLWILPGSQREPVHEHVPDRRPEALYGYVEIVDHDMQAAVPVLMEPGDLLLFDSHLMHRSTDNRSEGIRAAMVYHYSPAGTVDRTREQVRERLQRLGAKGAEELSDAQVEKLGEAMDLNRWVPVRRPSGA